MIRRAHRLAPLAALGVLVGGALVAGPVAQAGVVIDWGPNGNAYETSYNNATYISALGSSMSFVGIVNSFAGNLSAINPNTLGTEYTLYGFGFISGGTGITVGTFANAYVTTYTGGTVEVWQNSPRDADFAIAPSTFNNGSLFLRMTVPSAIVTFSKQNSNQLVGGGLLDSGTPNCTATAGSALPTLFPTGAPCPLRLTGGWLARPGNFPAGYSAHYDGKIDVDCATPAAPATWGRVKGWYRD